MAHQLSMHAAGSLADTALTDPTAIIYLAAYPRGYIICILRMSRHMVHIVKVSAHRRTCHVVAQSAMAFISSGAACPSPGMGARGPVALRTILAAGREQNVHMEGHAEDGEYRASFRE